MRGALHGAPAASVPGSRATQVGVNSNYSDSHLGGILSPPSASAWDKDSCCWRGSCRARCKKQEAILVRQLASGAQTALKEGNAQQLPGWADQTSAQSMRRVRGSRPRAHSDARAPSQSLDGGSQGTQGFNTNLMARLSDKTRKGHVYEKTIVTSPWRGQARP